MENPSPQLNLQQEKIFNNIWNPDYRCLLLSRPKSKLPTALFHKLQAVYPVRNRLSKLGILSLQPGVSTWWFVSFAIIASEYGVYIYGCVKNNGDNNLPCYFLGDKRGRAVYQQEADPLLIIQAINQSQEILLRTWKS